MPNAPPRYHTFVRILCAGMANAAVQTAHVVVTVQPTMTNPVSAVVCAPLDNTTSRAALLVRRVPQWVLCATVASRMMDLVSSKTRQRMGYQLNSGSTVSTGENTLGQKAHATKLKCFNARLSNAA